MEKQLIAKVRRLEKEILRLKKSISHLNFQIKERDKELKNRQVLVNGLRSGEFKSDIMRKFKSIERYLNQAFKGGVQYEELNKLGGNNENTNT